MPLGKGDKAPDFTLNSKTADGMSEVTLSDNFGKKKTVLLFVPFAFTSVCTEELCGVSGGIKDFEDLDAAVLGISTDSPFAQEAWANANKISIPLLSDYNKEVAGKYDVQYEELLGYKGVAKRSAFVIDTDGTILYSWFSDDPKNVPPFDEVKAALKN